MRLQDTPIERTGNMENLIDAEMAREDLGRMTYMSLEVRKKLFVCLMEATTCLSFRTEGEARMFKCIIIRSYYVWARSRLNILVLI